MSEIIDPLSIINESNRADLLALRGYLAAGLLEFALQLRPRVNYGIDVNRARKRVAVPFRAADMPSERAEFSHPDVGIVLTILAYYQIGLTEGQLLEAIRALVALSASAQKYHYELWLAPISEDIDVSQFGDATKLDVTNSLQLQLMFAEFRYSMAAINFWLNSCVFPRDMSQYSSRIGTSAWNLVGGRVDRLKFPAIGFSGTNDHHRLLPLQVPSVRGRFGPELNPNPVKMTLLLVSKLQNQIDL